MTTEIARAVTHANAACTRSSFGPLARMLPRPDRPGMDRLAGEKPLKVLRQSRRALISLFRLLFETLQTNRLQVARQARRKPRGGGGSWSETSRSVSRSVSPLNGGLPVNSS